MSPPNEACSRGALYCVLDHTRESGECHDEDGRPALPFGAVLLTEEMLDPAGPLVTAIRTNSAAATDAPAVREGPGWSGMIGGFCPVQGYGNVDGMNWYFRARGDAWSFEVWDAPFGDGGKLPVGDPLWLAEADYGEGDYDASWMPFSHAWRFIEESIALFRARPQIEAKEPTNG